MTATTLHITSGDTVGVNLAQAGLGGDILVWHDVLYDGDRCPGWPDADGITARVEFLFRVTGGGLSREELQRTMRDQYERLAAASAYKRRVLWFDACLFDQSMLVHLLACLSEKGVRNLELIEVASFPGITPYHGLGQLSPAQLASLYDSRQPVTSAQFDFAMRVDRALAEYDVTAWKELAGMSSAPLAYVPAAMARRLLEEPDPQTGLGRLESLALDAIRAGNNTPTKIYQAVSAADSVPQFWGDTTLWAIINGLAERQPPLVRITGSAVRLPQWESPHDLGKFRITAIG
ncbi:MAG: hypothetical protein GX574_09605 [Lentisphaerae bacterium]|nr:hypothetical protein [Lentisphaerota bacterium]HQL87304.1 hypothetical protein [Lentisphaeria bacterium]